MATLKISDLSVGDWVRCGDENKQVKCIDLQNNNYFVHFSDPDTNDNDYAHIFDIEPIPITADILEKNRFEEYSERKWGCEDNSPNPTLIQMCTPDGVMWFISFPTLFGLTWDFPIYHIHELQHLCHLAGVDKEINL